MRNEQALQMEETSQLPRITLSDKIRMGLGGAGLVGFITDGFLMYNETVSTTEGVVGMGVCGVLIAQTWGPVSRLSDSVR